MVKKQYILFSLFTILILLNTFNHVSGYGSRSYNEDASVVITFKDHIYIGTHNPIKGCELFRSSNGNDWERIVGENGKIPNGFGKKSNIAIWCGKVFGKPGNEYLYLGTLNILKGCEVWRSFDGENWSAVVGGDSKTPNGFGGLFRRFNYYAWYMEIFPTLEDKKTGEKVPHLCVGTFSFFTSAQLWVTSDGVNWNRLVGGIGKKPTDNGFGNRNNYGFRSMIYFKDCFYVGTAIRPFRPMQGCEIWRASDGKTWEQVNQGGFGDPDNGYAWSIAEFNGRLFVGTINLPKGCEIWSSEDGNSWTKVVDKGLGNRWNLGVRRMIIYGNQLYAGVCNPVHGCEIWNTSDGVNWTRLYTKGFDTKRNIAIRRFAEFNDDLYFGTWNFDGFKLYRYDNVHLENVEFKE